MEKYEITFPKGLPEECKHHCEVHQHLKNLFLAAAKNLDYHAFTFRVENGIHVFRVLPHVAERIGLPSPIIADPDPWAIHALVAKCLISFFCQ